MYVDVTFFDPHFMTNSSYLQPRASKKTTPSKVAKQATKATPTRSAATSSAILKLNEQDIRTLWSSFRNNGGTKVSMPLITTKRSLNLDSRMVFHFQKLC